jgi:predicted DCC family thiol-disulfide oxidoreductase YuxK
MEVDRYHTQGIIIFDGECNLCDKFVNFTIERDSRFNFKFTSRQSEAGRVLLQEFNFIAPPETIVLIEDGRYYTHSTAVLKVFSRLDGLWSLLSGLKVIPRSIRDAVYNWIARNRYQWLGKSPACRMMTADLQQRFLQ